MSGYQVMPRLTSDEYAELEESIVAVGVQVPITVDPDGTIIDGHHRDEIARKHALHCPRVTATGDAAMLRGLAFSLNLHRRHLSREQRRELIAESLRSDPQMSNREHARRTGASDPTVGTVRREMEDTGRLQSFSSRTSADGRTRPATQPPRPEPEPAPTFTCSGCGQSRPWEERTEFHDTYICNTCCDDEDTLNDVYDERNKIERGLTDEDKHEAVEYPDGQPPGFNPGDLEALNVRTTMTEPEPAPSAPKRRALEEQFFHAFERLNSVIVTLTNLGEDDRLPRNKEKVARYRNDLRLAVDALHRLDYQLS